MPGHLVPLCLPSSQLWQHLQSGTLTAPLNSAPQTLHPIHLLEVLSLQRYDWPVPLWNPHSEVFLPTVIQGCEKNLFVEGYLFFHWGSQNRQPPLQRKRREKKHLFLAMESGSPTKPNTPGDSKQVLRITYRDSSVGAFCPDPWDPEPHKGNSWCTEGWGQALLPL